VNHLLLVNALVVWAVLHLEQVILLQNHMIIADTLYEKVLVSSMEVRNLEVGSKR
jgi:hypothetical protein